MNIYVLEQIEESFYREVEGQVIVAESETIARNLANKHALAEGTIWEDIESVSCKLVSLSIRDVILQSISIE